jgi:predicted short-subunit dehydrogenase-like oxidoreductase (DUF2520 family)
MIKVVLIGSGNVAQHLVEAFAKTKEIEVMQVFSRRKETSIPLLDSNKITTDFNDLVKADIYIIAVSDDAISKVSSQLPFGNRLVVHTSGSVPIDSLDNKNRKGIFYPLQTFTKGKEIDFSQTDFDVLEKVAQSISNTVFKSNEKQRKALHISAVFVNNFVNEMYRIGNEICEENKVPFEILKPLILETVNKVMTLSPSAAQTGPAKRNDIQTIEAHLDFLSNENHTKIYKILTQSIQNYGKEL